MSELKSRHPPWRDARYGPSAAPHETGFGVLKVPFKSLSNLIFRAHEAELRRGQGEASLNIQ